MSQLKLKLFEKSIIIFFSILCCSQQEITASSTLFLSELQEINKTDKKIYLVFVAWNEDQKYTVVNDGLPQEQTAFVKIGAVNADQEYYKTTVDVSKLLDGQVQELKATLKMKRDGKDCLTYNVTIKVKQP